MPVFYHVFSFPPQLKRCAMADSTHWSSLADAQLVELAQDLARTMRTEVSSLDCLMLCPRPDDLVRFKLLQGMDLRAMQSRFGIIKYLNRLVTPLLNYVDIAVVTEGGVKPGKLVNAAAGVSAPLVDDNLSLSTIVKHLKGSYFMSVKQSVLNALLKRDSGASSSHPNSVFGGSTHRGQHVTINRLRAMAAREALNTGSTGATSTAAGRLTTAEASDPLVSVFGQLFSALRRAGYATFRNAQPHQQLLNVQLVGEVGYS
jgi:hypothetical protein